MALPYHCLRLMIRKPQSYYRGRLLQRDKSSVVNYTIGTRVCCLRQWTKETYRRGGRGLRTKRDIEVNPPGAEAELPSLWKPFLFTVGVCGCSFVGAMIWNYEKMRKVFRSIKDGTREVSDKSNLFRRFGFREHLHSSWSKMTSGQKLIVGIIASNVGVFLLWRIPSLHPTMIRYFTSSARHPLSSMILSTFSQINFLHLCVNMYVLWSFATVAVNLFGVEQFAAFYLSAGTVSSFASLAAKNFLRRPYSVSVGASGAIMGLIGAVCLTYPNAQLSIALVSHIFPHSFSASTGMKALIAVDLLGLVLGWRFMDHAGHLGGILFGLLYTKYGQKWVWGNREAVMKWWHDIRGKP